MLALDNIFKTSRTLLAGTVLTATALSAPSFAAEKVTELKHSVYVGGLFLGSIDTEIEQSNDSYSIETIANSSKTFDWAFRWTAKGKTVGLITEDKISPFLHRHESAWNDNRRTATMNYDTAGSVTVEKTGKESTDPNKYTPIDPDSTTNSVDPMSAILFVTNRMEAGEGCNAQVPVFDGRRVYDLKLTEIGEKLFNPSSYSVFEGTATGCKIEIVKKGGFKKNPDAVSQMNQDLIVWVAAPVEGGRVVPVRMQVDTDYGSVELHLERYSDGPVQLVSKNAN
jgi:hypothetical protein